MKLKKAISGVLATAVLASAMLTSVQPALAWEAPKNTWQPASDDASDDGVKARFFIGSDLHINRTDAQKKVANALDVFNTVDPDADGVLFVGDITNNGYESEYQTLMDTINDSKLGKAGKVVLSMGNHEYNTNSGTAMQRFETQTEQKANEVLYYDDAGNATDAPGDTLAATVIKLSAKNYNGDYTDQYEMVKTALETSTEKNADAPILIMGHHGIQDTAYVTNEWYGDYGEGTDKDMIALFEKYPQVIHFSGHSHATLEDARSIYQNDGYTAIQDGTIGAYFENESGKVDPTSGASATRPANSEVASQALRLDVLDDGTVKIYRMNLTTGEYMYVDEPWTFNPGDGDLPYDETRESSAAPTFTADAAVTAGDIQEKSAKVAFPAATAASGKNDDMIHSYKITLTPQDGGSTITRSVFADYYEAVPKDDWTVQVTGLAAGTTYDVAVTAVTSFGAESAAITGTLTTQAEQPYVTPAPDVLNIDFDSEHGTADANGHELKVYGEPTAVEDETFGTVYHFDGDDDGFRYAMSEADYAKYKDGYTMEVLVRLSDLAQNGQDIFGNMESAGCGFELDGDGKHITFWNHADGSYKKPTADISAYKDEWVHLTATFDGQTTKLYVNGALADSVESNGSMTVPASGARYFYLGGDSNGSGNLQAPAECDIALARLYSGAMNDTDVMKTYEAEMPYVTPTPDVLNIDFDSENSTADANGHELTVFGAPTAVEDAAFGTVYRFDGDDDGFRYAMTEADYAKIKYGYTMEVLVKSNGQTGGEQDFFSNQQSAGCGFALNSDGHTLEFWNNTTSDLAKPSTDGTGVIDDWTHLMATFDGQTTKLYVNGTFAASENMAGSLEVPGVHYFFVGGDSNSNGDLEFPANCDIAIARLYSGAMNDTDIAKTYENAIPSFSITVADSENGSASVAPETAKAGETVTITTAPAEGYKVDSVRVADANDQSVAVTDNGDGTYSFIQPASDVTVNVTFAKESSGSESGNGGSVSTPHYKPAVTTNDGGSVSVTPSAPKAGDEVTVTMTPDAGYEVASVRVTDKNGEAVAITENADGTFSFEQPRGKVTISVTFAEKTVAWENPYSDVDENDWFFDPVRFVQENGLMTGVSASEFAPDMTTTRGMLVTILWRQAGEPAATSAASFADVASGAYYADAVAWAAAEGIVNGYSATAFGPTDAISREQMAAILMNYSEYQGSDISARADLSGYSDADSVSGWAEEAMSWANAEGLINGVTDNTLEPQGAATRAQVAAILERFLTA